jgi:hypothetical protein
MILSRSDNFWTEAKSRLLWTLFDSSYQDLNVIHPLVFSTLGETQSCGSYLSAAQDVLKQADLVISKGLAPVFAQLLTRLIQTKSVSHNQPILQILSSRF